MEIYSNNDININVIVEKKITLKFFKECRTSRTYVIGLENFFDDEQINDMNKYFKKKLGTSLLKKELENTNKKNTINTIKQTQNEETSAQEIDVEKKCEKRYEYGYQGNHINTIQKILIDHYSVSPDVIDSV